jgi:hypothetical protein
MGSVRENVQSSVQSTARRELLAVDRLDPALESQRPVDRRRFTKLTVSETVGPVLPWIMTANPSN